MLKLKIEPFLLLQMVMIEKKHILVKSIYLLFPIELKIYLEKI